MPFTMVCGIEKPDDGGTNRRASVFRPLPIHRQGPPPAAAAFTDAAGMMRTFTDMPAEKERQCVQPLW